MLQLPLFSACITEEVFSWMKLENLIKILPVCFNKLFLAFIARGVFLPPT